jgi:hypothetical protein
MMEEMMSETQWSQNGGQPSWTLDTPVGRATILQETSEGKWVAQLDVEEATRQSELLESRDEAESWVATQVEAVQRESDVAPAVEELPDEE